MENKFHSQHKLKTHNSFLKAPICVMWHMTFSIKYGPPTNAHIIKRVNHENKLDIELMT